MLQLLVKVSNLKQTQNKNLILKLLRGHYGTPLKEIQDNFNNFVDYELLIATDVKRLYTKINGEPVNLYW